MRYLASAEFLTRFLMAGKSHFIYLPCIRGSAVGILKWRNLRKSSGIRLRLICHSPGRTQLFLMVYPVDCEVPFG